MTASPGTPFPLDAHVERVAGGLGPGHERKAAGGGLVRERGPHEVTR